MFVSSCAWGFAFEQGQAFEQGLIERVSGAGGPSAVSGGRARRMTQTDTVMRVAPARKEAAPRTAYVPSSTFFRGGEVAWVGVSRSGGRVRRVARRVGGWVA